MRRHHVAAAIAGIVVFTLGIQTADAKRTKSRDPESVDYAQTALNVLPAGQYGSVPPPAAATDQAQMYDGLTPLGGDVTDADLPKFFKSERFGTADQGPTHTEASTPKGVKIVRDGSNVPHIYGTTRDDVTIGTGWVTAEDRGLLIEEARYNARVAAIDAPGLKALSLISSLKMFVPSDQTEREVAKQAKVLEAAGPKGRAILHDIDQFVAGINAYYRATNNPAAPWTRVDVFALDALKGQFVGEGGGDEARRSMLLSGLEEQLGVDQGLKVFNDLRESNDPEAQTTVPGSVQFQPAPKSLAGNVLLDNGSLTTPPTAQPPTASTHASNALLVGAARSATKHPLMVAGPQIGYFYPGLLMEVDLHGPGVNARGSTTAPFPGYILIGRAQDYAWSLTSAGLDIVDTYVETLCDGSDTKYEYKGKCRDMTYFDAGVLKGNPDQEVAFYRTVHGPVVGYATVNGVRVAVTRKRASYGHDVLDLLLYHDLTLGAVHNVHDFFRAANQTPQTFNSFYVDDRDIGVFTSGHVPIRPADVDPGLPIDGRGKQEWRGYIGFAQHPQGINPPNGQIVNWNNRTIKGTRPLTPTGRWAPCAGRCSSRISAPAGNAWLGHRRDEQGRHPGRAGHEDRAGAGRRVADRPVTQHLHSKLLDCSTNGGPTVAADSTATSTARSTIRAPRSWTAWNRLADAWAQPVIGPLADQLASVQKRFDAPPGGQYDGWQGYMDKDLRTMLGQPVKGKFNVQYCGGGDLAACRTALWAALGAAGDELAASQGPDPTAWRSDATAERIKFVPGILSFTMRYANRPSGIQQVISFNGHRPQH